MASNEQAALKRSRSVKSKTSPAASSQSTGQTFPATETFGSLPQNALLPMELPLTLSAEGFPARILAQREKAQVLQGNAAGFGQRSPVLLANWNQVSSSWKTSQHCLVEGLETFSETWPRSGMMRNGTAYQLHTLAPLTGATASGLWQTPVSDDAVDRKAGKWNSRGEPKLSAQVKLWPTPCASMSKGSSPASLTRRNGRDRSSDRLDHAVMAADGGQLNPQWVEWLMGFPIGHTDLKG